MKRAGLILATLLFLLPAYAGAEAEHGAVPESAVSAHEQGKESASAAEHGEEHKAGLPQFDPSSFPSQVFWLAVAFVILYVVFSKKTLPEISSVVETRKGHIRSNLEEAEELKEKAERVKKAYEEILAEARDKASSFFLQAEQSVKEETAAALENFKAGAARRVQETEQSIARSKKEAMESISTLAAELASQAARKIVGISADISEAKTVVQNINRKAA